MNDKIQALIALARQYLQVSDPVAAEGALRRAVRLAPRDPAVLSELGFLLFGRKRMAEAKEFLSKAAAFDPRNAERQANLGAVCAELGDADGAIRACGKALALKPDLQPALVSIARVHAGLGQADIAAGCFLRLMALPGGQPDWLGEARTYLLGQAQAAVDRADIGFADTILGGLAAIDPADSQVWERLGVNQGLRQRFVRGLGLCGRAVTLAPASLSLRLNRAGLAVMAGRTALALADLARARALQPDHWLVYANRGAVLDKAGDIDGALRESRRALTIEPMQLAAWSNIIAMGMRSGRAAPDRDAQAFGAVAERLAGPPPAWPRPASRAPGGRLRVGYYSGDFRRHSCAWFLEPLFQNHDRSAVEVIAYAEVVSPDDVTARLRGMTDGWLSTCGMSDAALADRIRADGIDVLVDLAGHFTSGRPLLFASKPAPVQVNWLGFNATTGLRAIDWKLVDSWLAPEGRPLDWFAEGLWRLPRLSHCWRPPAEAPAPEMRGGRPPSFGSFNSLAKLSDETIALWARVLLANPDARLVLKADQAADHEVQRRLRADFGRHGILPERLTFLGYSHSVADHLALYAEVDVALDPFPYNGTTTTCEALWMGVPVVALAGDRLVGRVGFSLLAAVGHEGLVAGDAAEYVGIATALMDDRARLRDLRHGLRADVAGSPLRDEIGFARALETAYMDMLSRV